MDTTSLSRARHVPAHPFPRRSRVHLCVTAALVAMAGPVAAVEYPWTTGNYGPAIGPNPLTDEDFVFASAGGDKNFSSISIINNGGLIWQTTNRMGFASSSFTNNSLVDLQADANLTHIAGGASSFVNNNAFRKSGGTGATVIGSNIIFSNNGILDAQTGMIDFAGGSATFNGGSQFIGLGINRVSNNASFNDILTSSNLLLSGGNFTGGGVAGAIINGTVQWSGGQFTGNWQLPASHTLKAVAGGDKNFSSANFTNGGTIQWQTSDRMGFASSTFANNGLLDFQADANLTHIAGGASSFANNGTLRKSAGLGATVVGSNIIFANSGILDAQTGMIDFAGGSASFNAGTQFTGAGSNRVSNHASFNGLIQSDNLLLSGGNFTGALPGGATLNGTVAWTGGQFVGTWLLASGHTINATGVNDKNFNSTNFTNQGTIAWKSDARIGFASSNFTNDGLLDMQADANLTHIAGGASNFVNAGTLRKSVNAGVTSIGANVIFSNTGVINAQTGMIDFAGGSATFNNGTQFTGAGTNRVSNNASFNDAFSSANLLLAGGNFTGTGAIANGAVAWTGGQFVGTWQLPSGQVLNASGGNDKNFNSTTFTNHGAINWLTAARMGFASSNLTNNALIDIQADASLTHIAGGASSVNNSATGVFRKSGGDGSTVIGSNIIFGNSGLIQAQSGTIDFAGGSATFHAGTQFSGAGVNRISNAATFNGGFTSSNLVLAGGNYTGSAAALGGSVNWTGGQMLGTWNVDAGQTLKGNSGGDKNFNSTTFTNNGKIQWLTGERMGFASSTVNNNALIDIQADANLTHVGGGASSFTNSATGTFRKSGGAGSTVIGGNVIFGNAGLIQAQSGTIDFAGGSATFHAGTQFSGAGVNRVSNAAAFNGGFTSSNLVLVGGNYTGSAAALGGSVNWTGGQMLGTWSVGAGQTLKGNSGGDKNFNSTTFTNNGNIQWLTGERMGFASSNVNNNALIDIQADANLTHVGGSASTLVNNGTFRKSGGAGSTVIGGNVTFTNPGTIEALSGTIVLPSNFNNAGTIKGTAGIQTDTLTNTGTIAPGNSPGTLSLVGNLALASTSNLDIELASLGSFDVLAVSGTALLDGMLTVRRFGGYVPHLGDAFTFLTYASRVGASEFDGINTVGWGNGISFTVAYNPGSAVLTVASVSVTPVPEPQTYALMLAGLGLVGSIVWRRRAQAMH